MLRVDSLLRCRSLCSVFCCQRGLQRIKRTGIYRLRFRACRRRCTKQKAGAGSHNFQAGCSQCRKSRLPTENEKSVFFKERVRVLPIGGGPAGPARAAGTVTQPEAGNKYKLVQITASLITVTLTCLITHLSVVILRQSNINKSSGNCLRDVVFIARFPLARNPDQLSECCACQKNCRVVKTSNIPTPSLDDTPLATMRNIWTQC